MAKTHAYLEEQGLDLDRRHPDRDFVVCGDLPVAIEVTTTNPAQDDPIDLAPPSELVPRTWTMRTKRSCSKSAKPCATTVVARTAST
jgi:hypothetical protein